MPDPSKTVLFIGNHLSRAPRGVPSVAEEVAPRLEAAGWRTLLVSRAPSAPRRLYEMLFSVTFGSRRFQVAVVDVFSGRGFFWAAAVALLVRLSGKPFLLVLHGGRLPEFARRHPWAVRKVLGWAPAVATPSLFLREALSSFRPGILHLPNGIETGRYRWRIRAQVRPRLLWLRGFHESYDPLLVPEAVALLAHDLPGLQARMTGPDKGDGSRQRVLDAAARLGLSRILEVRGAVDKGSVPHELDWADVFFNTTRYESFGVAVLEAAAAGVPIVTLSVGEIPYLWEDGVDALLVAEREPAALATAVRRVLTEPGLAERLSRNARAKAEKFDWSQVAPQWDALLSALAEGKSP